MSQIEMDPSPEGVVTCLTEQAAVSHHSSPYFRSVPTLPRPVQQTEIAAGPRSRTGDLVFELDFCRHHRPLLAGCSSYLEVM
jgi:hypothetical protein